MPRPVRKTAFQCTSAASNRVAGSIGSVSAFFSASHSFVARVVATTPATDRSARVPGSGLLGFMCQRHFELGGGCGYQGPAWQLPQVRPKPQAPQTEGSGYIHPLDAEPLPIMGGYYDPNQIQILHY